MSIRSFLKDNLRHFFIITTCITAVYATLGKAWYPEETFGFEAFSSPLLLSFISLLPSIILYSRRELNLRQTFIRKLLYLAAIIAILAGYGRLQGQLMGTAELLIFIFSICLVYFAVNFLGWVLDRKDTKEINIALKELQSRN